MASVFITGTSGGLASNAVEQSSSGHGRGPQPSPGKSPRDCAATPAGALDTATSKSPLTPDHTFIHLVGVAHFVCVSVAPAAPVREALY
jgi:hypothetical protein